MAQYKERVKKAYHYQKKAIKALFPEAVTEHFENIEHEMKGMFYDLAKSAASDYVKEHGMPFQERHNTSDTEKKDEKVHKVDIE